jgi:hypothetical protein
MLLEGKVLILVVLEVQEVPQVAEDLCLSVLY